MGRGRDRAVLHGRAAAHPSLTGLVDPLIGPHPLKSAAVLVWLFAGWGLVRR